MTTINTIGDTLSIRLLRETDYNNAQTVATLVPAIEGMVCFRVLSNHVCEIYCSFASSSGVLDENGEIFEERHIIAGHDDIWYRCISSAIFRPIVNLVNPLPGVALFSSIDLVFQFASQVPEDYILNY